MEALHSMLTDFYVRELEYQLALEMLDRLLIRFQPQARPRLMKERARLYRLDGPPRGGRSPIYEALWKLPDTNRGQLALNFAEICLAAGDLERAGKVLAGVGDPLRVAELYTGQGQIGEAIAVLERAAAGSPDDGRVLLELAGLRAHTGAREEAVETLERLLALKGDSWQVLMRLGELYDDLRRVDDAVAVGARLFALLRADDTLPEEEDEGDLRGRDPWSAPSSYRGLNAGQRYAQRLSQLRRFFESQGRREDFVRLALAELELAPSNGVMLGMVMRILQQMGEREEEMRAIVRSVRAATRASGRVPPENSPRQWEQRLDRLDAQISTSNSRLAESRRSELAAAVAEGSATAHDHRELALLFQTLQRDAEQLSSLVAGAAAYPDSIPLNAGLAVTLEGDGRLEEAVPVYRRLVELLVASDWKTLESDRLDREFRRLRSQLFLRFPVHLQPRLDDAVLRRLFDLWSSPSTRLRWSPGNEPSLDGARMRLARCLFKLGRTEEAREVLVALEPDNAESMERWVELARVYFEENLHADARRIYELLIELAARLDVDPVLGHDRGWVWQFDEAMRDYARVLQKEGDVLSAYDLLRGHGFASDAEALLTNDDAFEKAEIHYRAERLAATPPAEARPADLRAWREASIKLADSLQFQKRWDEVLALYEELADRLPEDFSILEQVAALHLRAGRVEEAVATRYRAIERKRDLNRRAQLGETSTGAEPTRRRTPPGRVLSPLSPASARPNGPRLSSSAGLVRDPSGLHGLSEDYMAILRIHLDREQPENAAAVLQRMAREDAAAFRRMGSEVRELMESYRLGARGLHILRLLAAHDPDDELTHLAYAKALLEADRADEARRILTRLANTGRRQAWVSGQARAEAPDRHLRRLAARPARLASRFARFSALRRSRL